MEVEVVVSFVKFLIDAGEEELSSILEELQSAGIEQNTVDDMFEKLLGSEDEWLEDSDLLVVRM